MGKEERRDAQIWWAALTDQIERITSQSIYIRKAQTYLSVCPERSQNTKQRKCIGFNPSTQTT